MMPFDFTGCWVEPDFREKMAASSRAQVNEYSLELLLSTKVFVPTVSHSHLLPLQETVQYQQVGLAQSHKSTAFSLGPNVYQISVCPLRMEFFP